MVDKDFRDFIHGNITVDELYDRRELEELHTQVERVTSKILQRDNQTSRNM